MLKKFNSFDTAELTRGRMRERESMDNGFQNRKKPATSNTPLLRRWWEGRQMSSRSCQHQEFGFLQRVSKRSNIRWEEIGTWVGSVFVSKCFLFIDINVIHVPNRCVKKIYYCRAPKPQHTSDSAVLWLAKEYPRIQAETQFSCLTCGMGHCITVFSIPVKRKKN
jgi:hypothetical protein